MSQRSAAPMSRPTKPSVPLEDAQQLPDAFAEEEPRADQRTDQQLQENRSGTWIYVSDHRPAPPQDTSAGTSVGIGLRPCPHRAPIEDYYRSSDKPTEHLSLRPAPSLRRPAKPTRQYWERAAFTPPPFPAVHRPHTGGRGTTHVTASRCAFPSTHCLTRLSICPGDGGEAITHRISEPRRRVSNRFEIETGVC